MIIIKKLRNGVRVALEEIPYVRSISFGIWVRNGSRNESKTENGSSHYIEHMFFKGTKTRTGKQIAEEMDALGGQINAYTTKEYTCYHTRILDKHFGRALDVMSDMFLHSNFSEDSINKERNVITEEISMYDDAPEELVHDALQEAVWSTCSLGMPILGTVDTIEQMDRDKLLNYLKKNYHTENTVLSVAGNFKEEEIMEKLEESFGEWEPQYPFENKDTKTVYVPSLVKIEKEIEQVHMCLAYPSYEREHEKKYALAVFNTIFGGGMSSCLFQKIREDCGLTYTIYSYTSAFDDAGIFVIYAGMNPNQTREVLELIFEEIENIKTTKISEKMIEVTKEQIISNYIIGTESTSNRMTGTGASMLLRNKAYETSEIIKKIEMVTLKDVEDVIQTIFKDDKMSLSLVGNIKDIDVDDLYKGK